MPNIIIIWYQCSVRYTERFTKAEQVGKLQAERFIEERIKSNDVGFYETIKKNKLKTLTSLLTTEKVVIQADHDLFARSLVIREKREVSMKDFLRYSLGPVAWSLATPIGNVYKSTKLDLFTYLEKKINLVNQIPADAARVYDGLCVSSTDYHQVLILSKIYLIMS